MDTLPSLFLGGPLDDGRFHQIRYRQDSYAAPIIGFPAYVFYRLYRILDDGQKPIGQLYVATMASFNPEQIDDIADMAVDHLTDPDLAGSDVLLRL